MTVIQLPENDNKNPKSLSARIRDVLDGEFKEAREHVKDAVRSTLLAMRGAVDAALGMLDGGGHDGGPQEHAASAPGSQDERPSGQPPVG